MYESLWIVFRPGGAGFPITLIVLIAIGSAILSFIFVIIGKQYQAQRIKLYGQLSCAGIVLWVGISYFLKIFALMGLTLW